MNTSKALDDLTDKQRRTLRAVGDFMRGMRGAYEKAGDAESVDRVGPRASFFTGSDGEQKGLTDGA